MDLNQLRQKSTRFGIGLMSGTSCDGVDAVLVRLKGSGTATAMKLLEHQGFPYPGGLRARLLREHLDAREICLLNFELGERFSDAARALIVTAEAQGETVDFIASHGHTVAHFPPPGQDGVGTLQIGESAVIAERTGVPVVSDFRPRDMAAGGQGAPLVTYPDWVLFRKPGRTVACLNIGGIANFTVVTEAFEEIVAFDTGPGNMIIDGTVRLLSKGVKDMDENGRSAARGKVIDEYLDYLVNHPYFDRVPPKSTGREEFGVAVYLRDAIASRRDHSFDDLVATATVAVAKTIADAYRRFVAPRFNIDHVIVGGGGALNPSLMKLLKKELGEVRVFTTDQYGIPIAAREAIAFAILGNETLQDHPANVPQATGAQHAVVLGKITPA